MIDGIVSESAQAVVRALTFGATLVVTGALLFATRLAAHLAVDRSEPVAAYRRVRTALGLALLVLAAALVLRLVQQSAAFADSPGEWTSMVPLVLARTTWGIGWLVQLAGLLLVAVGSRGPNAAMGEVKIPFVIGVVALATAPALSGHAIGAPTLAPLAIVLDVVHVLGAGAWLGTLAVIAVAMLPASGGERSVAETGPLVSVVERFSPLALASAVLVAATGAFASWLHLDAVASLWTTPYGRTLLVKVGLVTCVAASGAYNWRVATPRLRAKGDPSAIRRGALIELLLAVALVAVTAILVATPLPAEM